MVKSRMHKNTYIFLIILSLIIMALGITTVYGAQYSNIKIDDRGEIFESFSGTGRYENGKAVNIKYVLKPGISVKNWLIYDGHDYTIAPGDFNIREFTAAGSKTFIPNADFHIIFDLDGGTGVDDITYDMLTEDFIIAEPTRKGYDFVGYTGSNGNTPQRNINIPKYSGGNKKYKANWTKKVYTVNFDNQGYGNNISSQEIAYKEKVTKPADPEREFYDFKGWCLDKKGTKPFDFNTEVASAFTLYAKWEIKTYKVTFVTNGGTAIDAQKVPYGQTAERPQDPEQEYLTFTNWYKDGDLTELFDFNTPIIQNTMVYAGWDTKRHTVSFECDNGEAPFTQSVVHKNKAVRPQDPVKEGYTFKNWFSEPQHQNIFDFETVIDKDTTVYADWDKNHYNISFDTDGGTSISTQSVAYMEKVAKPQDPSKDGYTFIGWYTDKTYKDEYGFDEPITGARTIYAKWEENSYSVVFIGNNNTSGAMSAQNFLYTEEKELKKNNYKRTYKISYDYNGIGAEGNKTSEDIDYIFSGWALSYNGDKVYENEQIIKSVLKTGTLELYAVWIPISAYLPMPAVTGYTFEGWYKDEDLSQKVSGEYIPAEDTTLYAKWTENTYKITYDGTQKTSGSMEVQEFAYTEEKELSDNKYERKYHITYNYGGTTDNSVKTEETAEYGFLGWGLAENGEAVYGNKEKVSKLAEKDKANITLYALWTPVSVTLPAPAKTGFEFDGWYADAGYNEYIGAAGDEYIPGKDAVIYAKWNENSYSVIFNGNNSTDGNMLPQSFRYTEEKQLTPNSYSRIYEVSFEYNGADETDMPALLQSTYGFAGWSVTPDREKSYEDRQKIKSISTGANVNLYALWTPASITLPSPKRLGYTFKGWYKNGALTEFVAGSGTQYTPVEDMTLYAKWERIPCTVTFDVNGGDTEPDNDYIQTVFYGDKAIRPHNEPAKEGYTFSGWYNDKNASSLFDFDTTITEDKTVYASYGINSYVIAFNTNGGSAVAPQSIKYNNKATKPADPVKTGYTFKGWYREPAFINSYDFDALVTSNVSLYAKWDINEYTVTFNTNGAGAVPTQTIEHGNKADKPTDPIKTGYTFRGWYTESGFIHTYDFNTLVTENKTLYAKWEINTYNAVFDTDGGNAIPSQTINYNGKIERPADPVKTGYTFKGWYKESAYTNTYDFNTPVAADVTLYAKWAINNYTVTFNTNGGGNIPAQSIAYNQKATKPADPVKTGYTFRGWYRESTFANSFDFNTPITADITLYAKWEINRYTVAFISNGGSDVASQTVEYNKKATKPADPSKTGYTFKGWFTESELMNGYSFEAGVTKNTNLYAKWEINNYTVTFNSNGGTEITSQTIEYNKKAAAPADPVKAGHTFKGWYTENTYINIYDFDTPVTNNITLYARWNTDDYVVTFNTNGGSSIEAQTITYNNKAVKPDDPTKAGHTFKGWYTESGLINAYDFDTLITEDRTLYAKWEINNYTVTFNSNGGSSVAQQTVTYNQKATKPSNPTKAGHTFKGWYTESELTNAYDFNTLITGNRTLYAKWEINKYTVTFNTNGGGNIPAQTITYNDKATEPDAPVKTGYTFKGWYTEATFINVYDFNNPVISNVSLYAKWEINKYAVTFNTNGGGQIASQTIEYGNKASRPANPSKTGHTFIGWYTESELVNAYDFNSPVTANVELHAKWAVIVHNVSFNTNGGNAIDSQSVEYNGRATEPDTPVKAGYTFKGWYTESTFVNVYDFSTPVTSNKTLYAKWQINKYNISFNTNGGNTIASQFIEYNSTVVRPLDPEKAGHTFVDWFSDSGLTHVYDFATPVTEPKTLHAKWQINNYAVNFITDGGSAIPSQSIQYNSKAVEPAVPVKDGYIFRGWYSDTERTQVYDFNTLIRGTTNIYAKWQINVYSVTFNSHGGNAVPSQSVNHGDRATEPTAPVREGYTFDKWYSDSSLKTAYDFNSPVTSALTLHAGWNINKYTVTFNRNGHGTAPANQTVDHGNKATDPGTLTETGFAFGGWFIDDALTQLYDFNTPVTKDMIIYAKWSENGYYVTFNGNNATSGGMVPQYFQYTQAQPLNNNLFGRTYRITYEYNEATGGASKEYDNISYRFTGWSTEPDGDKVYDNNEEVSMLSTGASVNLYALWESAEATLPTPIKTGCNFAGWYSDAGFMNYVGDGGSKYTPVAPVTLYAKWSTINHSITFNSMGGSAVPSQTVNYNNRATVPAAPTKTGYTFGGWYAEEACSNVFDFNTPITSDTILYAKWNINKYTVEFNTFGGSHIASQTVEYNGNATRPDEPTRTGYTFRNWYSNYNCTNLFDFSTPIKNGTTIYAGWDANDYHVTFNTNGGGQIPAQTVKYNQKATRPTDPEKEGYTFNGWYTDESLTTPYDFNALVQDDIHLNAGWIINQYTVSFDTRGGSEVTSQDITHGQSATEPSVPEKAGCTFNGWYTDETCLTSYDFSLPVTSALVLYADWTVNQYTVAFNTNGGNAIDSQLIEYGGKVTEPAAPTKTGSTFGKWYSDESLSEEYDFDTPVTGHMTLYAGWTINRYTVTFDTRGGNNIPSQTIEYNATAVCPEDPVKDIPEYDIEMNSVSFTQGDDTHTYRVVQGEASAVILKNNDGIKYIALISDIPFTYTINDSTEEINATRSDAMVDGVYYYHGIDMSCTDEIHDTVPSVTGVDDIEDIGKVFKDIYLTPVIFDKWYADEELTVAFDFDAPITHDTTVYARWIMARYKVNFNSMGGSEINPQMVNMNETAIMPEAPVREGHTFDKWFSDEERTAEYDFNTPVTQNITLYAGWTLNDYTVSFNTNGGNSIVSQTVTYGQKAHRPSVDPTKEGNTFNNWYTDSSLSSVYDFENMPVLGDTTIYAKWDISQYTVSFDMMGAEGEISAQTINHGSRATKPANPTRDDYTFNGWFTERECINEFNFITQIKNDTVLYAKWLPVTVYVSFDNKGHGASTPATQGLAYGGKATQPANLAETGYVWQGWTQRTDMEDATFVRGSEDMDETYLNYPEFVKTHNIEMGQGSFTTTVKNTQNRTNYTITDNIKPVYHFAIADNYEGNQVEKYMIFMFSEDDFKVNGNNATYNYTTKRGETYKASWTLFTNDTPTSFFNGAYASLLWTYIQPDVFEISTEAGCDLLNDMIELIYHGGEGYKTFDFKNTPVTEDTTIYAKWKEITYTMLFDANGGNSGEMDKFIISYSQTKTLPLNKFGKKFVVTYEYNGAEGNCDKASDTVEYDFLGWQLSTTANRVVLTDGQEISGTWFPGGFGSQTTRAMYAYWNGSVTLPTPTKTGYTAYRWHKNPELTSAVANAGGPYKPSGDITLYIQWTAIKYTIRYNVNKPVDAGNRSVSATHTSTDVRYDSPATLLGAEDITMPDYQLVNWNSKADGTGISYELGQQVLNLTNKTEDVYMYAQWYRPSESTVIYDNGVWSNVPEGMSLDNYVYTTESGHDTAPDALAEYYFSEKCLKTSQYKNDIGQWVEKEETDEEGETFKYIVKSDDSSRTNTDIFIPINRVFKPIKLRMTVKTLATNGVFNHEGWGYGTIKEDTMQMDFAHSNVDINSCADDWTQIDLVINQYTKYQYIDYIHLCTAGSRLGIKKIEVINEPVEDFYTVTYDPNIPEASPDNVDQIIADTRHVCDLDMMLTGTAYTLDGYTFLGFNTERDGSGTMYQPKEYVNGLGEAGETITLYAQWEINVQFVLYSGNTLIDYIDIYQPDGSVYTYLTDEITMPDTIEGTIAENREQYSQHVWPGCKVGIHIDADGFEQNINTGRDLSSDVFAERYNQYDTDGTFHIIDNGTVNKDMGTYIQFTVPQNAAKRGILYTGRDGSAYREKLYFETPDGMEDIGWVSLLDIEDMTIGHRVGFDMGGITDVPQERIVGYEKKQVTDEHGDTHTVFTPACTEEPEEPVQQEYSFKGWYSDREHTKPFTFDTPITNDMTIFAKLATTNYKQVYEYDYVPNETYNMGKEDIPTTVRAFFNMTRCINENRDVLTDNLRGYLSSENIEAIIAHINELAPNADTIVMNINSISDTKLDIRIALGNSNTTSLKVSTVEKYTLSTTVRTGSSTPITVSNRQVIRVIIDKDGIRYTSDSASNPNLIGTYYRQVTINGKNGYIIEMDNIGCRYEEIEMSNLLADWTLNGTIQESVTGAQIYSTNNNNHTPLSDENGYYIKGPGWSENITFPEYINTPGLAFEIEIGDIDFDDSSMDDNRHLFSYNMDNASHSYMGLLYKKSLGRYCLQGPLGYYQVSNITDPEFFANSILRIEIGKDNNWKIFKDDKLVFSPKDPMPPSYYTKPYRLGGTFNAFNKAYIKEVKIYKTN